MKWESTGSDCSAGGQSIVCKASWALVVGGGIGGSSWMNSMLSEEVTGTPRQYGYTKLLSFYMLSLRIGFILNVLLWRVSNIFDIPGLEYSLTFEWLTLASCFIVSKHCLCQTALTTS